MIALAGTIALMLTVVLLSKVSRRAGPIPLAALVVLAAVEVALVYLYMSSLEVPVQ